MKRVSQTCRARFLAFMTNGMNTWNEASDAGHPGRLVGTVGHEVATVHTDLGERVGWSVRAPIDTTFTRDMSAPRLWVVNPCDEEGEGSEGVEIDFNSLFESIDTDGSGEISYEEFEAWFNQGDSAGLFIGLLDDIDAVQARFKEHFGETFAGAQTGMDTVEARAS